MSDTATKPDMKTCVKAEAVPALVWGALMLGAALIARYAFVHGYIDADTKLRVVAMNGLYVAWLGNRLPKAVVPYAWAQQSRRFSGWMLVLSGLVYAGLWAFAPIAQAVTLGTAAIIGGIILSLGYCLWLRSHKSAQA